jgi:hypothetical protein
MATETLEGFASQGERAGSWRSKIGVGRRVERVTSLSGGTHCPSGDLRSPSLFQLGH